MTGRALLDRIAAAGATASLDLDGRVRVAGASRLPAGLLELLRQNRAVVAEALAERRGAATGQAVEEAVVAPVQRELDPLDASEQAAMADHRAAPPADCPWRPGDPDPLRDGLLAGWWARQAGCLFALAERLEAARPRQAWGVRELDWRAWEAAAREAAGLPSGEWSAWRGAVGTEGAP